MRRRSRLIQATINALVMAAVAVLALAPPAAASNWGADPNSDHWCTRNDPDSGCTADDANHFVYFEADVPSAVRQAFTQSLAQDYTIPGELTSQVTSNRAQADVIVKWKNVPGRVPWAYTTCAKNATYGGSGWNRWCKPQLVVLDSQDQAFADDCFASDNCRDWVACHELGHTLGLLHNRRTTSCLSKVKIPGVTHLDAHDIEHLVDCYPKSGSTRTKSCAKFGQ